MEEFAVDALAEWESEGGAPAQSEASSSLAPATTAAMHELTGTVNHIDWAEQIKERVNKDFDRVGRDEVGGRNGIATAQHCSVSCKLM